MSEVPLHRSGPVGRFIHDLASPGMHRKPPHPQPYMGASLIRNTHLHRINIGP